MKSIIEHIKEKFDSIKKESKEIKKHTYKIVAGVSIITVTFLWLGTRNNAYAVMVDNQVVAVVKQKEEAKEALENVITTIKTEKGVDITVNEAVVVEPVKSKTEDIDSKEQVVQALSKAVSYNIEAYEIIVDGETKAVVANKEVASDVLTQVAKKNLPKNAEVKLEIEAPIEDAKAVTAKALGEEVAGGVNAQQKVVVTPETSKDQKVVVTPETSKDQEVVVTSEASKDQEVVVTPGAELIQMPESLPAAEIKTAVKVVDAKVDLNKPKSTVKKEVKKVDFNEDIEVQNVYVDPTTILDKKEAVDVLLSNTEKRVEYTLKEGDNIWDIAVNNHTTMEHILEINPQVKDETKMQIGEKIKLEVPDPLVSIATVEQATFKELIPAEIKYVEDKTLYENETKVKEKGNDGSKQLIVLVERVNGKEIQRKLVKETVLREPKEKVIAYGTKKKPEVAVRSVVRGGLGQFVHPLNGRGRISSDYGYRGSQFHKGIDIAASAGTPIYASDSGRVIYSGYNSGGYGKLVIIDHGNGYETYYGHNSSLYVSTGEYVSRGENIAGVGSTGDSSGNHVHFEIRYNGTPINPYYSIY